MKKYLLSTGAVILTCIFVHTAMAQTLVYPSNADNVWYVSSGTPSYILGFNTALIDYNNISIGKGSLAVSDYFGNGTKGGVVFRDIPQGYTVHIPYHGGSVPDYIMMSSPDIIVGNDSANPLTDYRVAVAYMCYNTAASTVLPQIDYWLVQYTGVGTFTVSYVCSTVFTNVNTSTIHIDVIAQSGYTGYTGFPWCDSFKVTFDDYTSTTTSDIHGYSGSLNAPLCDTVSSALVLVSGVGLHPDVAAIQRYGAGMPPPIDNLALITYTDFATSTLNYIEWDATTGAISSPSTLDASMTTTFSYPRIDAPDDYNINSPSPLRSYYKVVAQANNPGPTFTSNSYDNIIAGSPFPTYPGAVNEYAPTVAFGGNNNTQYQVAHSSDDNSLSGAGYPYWNTFMEPIDWTVPASIAPAPSLTVDYFLVNLAPYNPANDLANGICLTAISTPCNNPSGKTLVSWSFQKTALGVSEVWYKATAYGGTDGYAFRPASTGTANTLAAGWNVYPNPAATALSIYVPSLTGAKYEITDMPGRTMQRGNLPAGDQAIGINSLAPGTYIISLYEGDKKTYTRIFVKQ